VRNKREKDVDHRDQDARKKSQSSAVLGTRNFENHETLSPSFIKDGKRAEIGEVLDCAESALGGAKNLPC